MCYCHKPLSSHNTVARAFLLCLCINRCTCLTMINIFSVQNPLALICSNKDPDMWLKYNKINFILCWCYMNKTTLTMQKQNIFSYFTKPQSFNTCLLLASNIWQKFLWWCQLVFRAPNMAIMNIFHNKVESFSSFILQAIAVKYTVVSL